MDAKYFAKDVVLITLLANAIFGFSPIENRVAPSINRSEPIENLSPISFGRFRTSLGLSNATAMGDLIASNLPNYHSTTPIFFHDSEPSMATATSEQNSIPRANGRAEIGIYFAVENHRIILPQESDEDWIESLSLPNLYLAPNNQNASRLTVPIGIEIGNLPARLANLAGQAVTVYEANGDSCQTWIDGFQLERQRVANDRSNQDLQDHESLFGPPSDSYAGQPSEEFSDDWRNRTSVILTATLASNHEHCRNPRWARLSNLPDPKVLSPVALSTKNDATLEEVWAHLQLNEDFTRTKKSYVELLDEPDANEIERKWKRYVRRHLKISSWQDAVGRVHFVSAALRFPEDRCHNWGAPHTYVWEISQGRFTRLYASFAGSPIAMMDIDTDGNADLVFVSYQSRVNSLSYGSVDGLVLEEEFVTLHPLDSDPC